MNSLQHIVEPESLLLTWQPPVESSVDRTRRVVGEIVKQSDGAILFRYLHGTPDFVAATAAGFRGHPAFDLKETDVRTGVMEAFLRRLPPRKREDFPEFLALHRLPSPFSYSDVALLGYTGAHLPSDGFSLVPVFNEHTIPCEYILEVAGFRHEPEARVESLSLGDSVDFEIEPNNAHDPGALAIKHKGKRIGYVNRLLKNIFSIWLAKHPVLATIERINGKPERPLIYVKAKIGC